MLDISQFGFPWTKAAPVEEQKHTPTAQTAEDLPMRLEIHNSQHRGIQLPNA